MAIYQIFSFIIVKESPLLKPKHNENWEEQVPFPNDCLGKVNEAGGW